MYIEPDEDLLSKLDVTGFKVGDVILFCSECLWQTHQPGIGIPNQCPICLKRGLSLSEVSQDLIILCSKE